MSDFLKEMSEHFENMRLGMIAELMKAHDKEIGGLFNELSAEGKREVVSFSDDLAMSAAEPDEAVESIAALTKKIHAQENGDDTRVSKAEELLHQYDKEAGRLFSELSDDGKKRIESMIWNLALLGTLAGVSMEDITELTKKLHAEENAGDEEEAEFEVEVLNITILSQEYEKCDCSSKCGKYHLRSVDASCLVRLDGETAWSKVQRVGALDGGRSYKFLDRAAEHEMMAAGADDFIKYLGDEIFKRTFGNPDYATKNLNAF